MKWIKNILNKFKALSDSITRYPLTVAFLFVAAVFVAIQISQENDYSKIIAACAVGAVLAVALQAAWERFFEKLPARLLLMIAVILLTTGYYFLIRPSGEFSNELMTKTSIALAALFMAYIWMPSIGGKISFHNSFMAVFKAVFLSALYSFILWGGCSGVLAAIDVLIHEINPDAYGYAADIVFVLFAPVFMLSLIPRYPGKKVIGSDEAYELNEKIKKAIHCPKFLEVLLSYILIPLAAAYTIILIIYIAMNVTGEFWTDSLLEPMLIAYAVAIIVLFILVSGLENKFSLFFKKVFPKVMLPIVLFQMISSFIIQGETGITHMRYFVLLYGLFALCAGVVMSFGGVRKNGVIAVLFILFAVISITPPVDAFTLSKVNQTNRLQKALEQNDMLVNDAIIPKEAVSNEDKAVITQSVEYLSEMEYIDKVDFIPDDFDLYEDFTATFGFSEYYAPTEDESEQYVYVALVNELTIDIQGYDYLVSAYISNQKENDDISMNIMNKINYEDEVYSLESEFLGDTIDIVLKDKDGQELVRFDTDKIFDKFSAYPAKKNEISMDDATFIEQSDTVSLMIIVQNLSMDTSQNETDKYADVYLLIRFIK
jgi:hypothetical protein